jgi:DNA-binding transcriptional MerR regulator
MPSTSDQRPSRKPARAASTRRKSKTATRTKAASGATTTSSQSGSDGTSPDKRYYRIGEVSRITDVKPYVLRYWESEFRWMTPHKSRSKQRLYRRRDIDMILLIKKLLYEQRFTIAGARNMLREQGAGRALETGNLTIELDHRSRYRKIRGELESIRAML